MKSIKAIFRRGPSTKIEGQHLGDNLSRASSVTNLDADPKSGKGARPRKSSSRDRIDKIGEGRKNDKKEITRNNNKVDSGEHTYPSVDSLSEDELLHLRRQLQEMAQEKTNLALQLGEQKGQLNMLQKEIKKLKEESNIQLEHLTEENTALRNRLRDVAHSPLSDNEKQQLLFDSHRHHSSAPASIATNIIDDGNGADTTCTTPDWDKHSSSNVSEVSVACLQDKINQMQETHYSTNEELQATLQELTDLQRQLTELQQENERLNEEKTLMFDSLCRQTERLNDSRSEVESLKQLLYQEKDDTGQFETAVEREQKLVDMLKSAQEEREGLLVKLEQLNNELQETRSGIIEKDDQIGHQRERVRTLECTLDAKHAEHKLLDQDLAQAKDQCSGKQIEINRLTDLLDNARTKINELEQDRALSDKSELDELLDNARKEKDSLESEVAHLKEQLAISKNEIEKLREQVSILQEECKVTRNNAKTTQSDLEYKCEKLVKDKNVLNEQLLEFQEALNELQVQSQCQLEDKRQLSAVLSETQRNLSEAERKNLSLENEVEEVKRLRSEENDEWEKFQDDLLTSVRVANDFKTEAQQELQRMILENKSYRDRERQLKAEIEKLKGGRHKSEGEKENMDILVKRPNKRRTRTRKDSGTVSSSSKSDKIASLPQNPIVKRRENKTLKSKRLKTLSVEEEMLLTSLESYHADIDKSIPDEFLTEEQRVIRKLKIIYEDDFLKVKPVAPKPKDQLAISKPLLDSVLTNPKLMSILNNPKVKTVEDMATFEKEAPEIRNLIQDIDRSKKGKSENFPRSEFTKRISIIGRSLSCDDVYEIENNEQNLRLYRTPESEDLTRDDVSTIRRQSSLVPSDSASNYNRYSDFSVLANSKDDIVEENVKYSTLERIVKTIPSNAPESSLTKEQKFAVKLLEALEERKNTLKKSEKAKTLPISTPTPDSVLRNPKLREIFYDPTIKDIRRKSEIGTPSELEKVLRGSRSYENITFTFDKNRHSVNVFRSSSDSSSGSFSGAEFNVETGQTGPYEPIRTWTKPAGTPKIPRKFGMSTFGESKGKIANQNDSKTKANLLKGDLVAISRSPDKEKQSNTTTSQKPAKSRTIVANYDRDRRPSIDTNLKVDLLQEKIKKKAKEALPLEEKDNNNNGKENISCPTETHVLHVATIETLTDPIYLAEEDDSLTYNETLQRVYKRETSVSTSRPSVDDTIKNITEKLQEIRKLITEENQNEVLDSMKKNVPISSSLQEIDNKNKGEQTDECKLRDGQSSDTMKKDVSRSSSHEETDNQNKKEQIDECKLRDRQSSDTMKKYVSISFSHEETDNQNKKEQIDECKLRDRQSSDTMKKDVSISSSHEETDNQNKKEQMDECKLRDRQSSDTMKKDVSISSSHEETDNQNKKEQIDECKLRDRQSSDTMKKDVSISSSHEETDNENKDERIDECKLRDKQSLTDAFSSNKTKEGNTQSIVNISDNPDILPTVNKNVEDYEILRVNYMPDDNLPSVQETVDGIAENASDYDYHSILKENRVGVTPPLSYRLSYKDVVKEMKGKFIDLEITDDQISSESKEYVDDLNPVDVEVRSRSTGIDKEMEDIIETYMHTRVSQLIKQSEAKPKSSVQLPIYSDKQDPETPDISFQAKLAYSGTDTDSFNADTVAEEQRKFYSDSSNLETASALSELVEQVVPDISTTTLGSNLEPLNPFLSTEDGSIEILNRSKSPTELKFSDDSYFELQDGNVTNIKAVKQDIPELNLNLSEVIEATRNFLEDQRKVLSLAYSFQSEKEANSANDGITNNLTSNPETQSTSNLVLEESPERTDFKLSIITEKSFENLQNLSIGTISQYDAREAPSNSLNIIETGTEKSEPGQIILANPTVVKEIPSFEILPDENQIFTEEELEVVQRARKHKFVRPLSDINDADLALIQALSMSYEEEVSPKTKDNSNTLYNILREGNSLEDQEPAADEKAKDAEGDESQHNLNNQKTIQEDEDLNFRPRPLSDIKQNDLALIEKLTNEYLSDQKSPKLEETTQTVSIQNNAFLPKDSTTSVLKVDANLSNVSHLEDEEIAKKASINQVKYSNPIISTESKVDTDDLETFLTKLTSSKTASNQKKARKPVNQQTSSSSFATLDPMVAEHGSKVNQDTPNYIDQNNLAEDSGNIETNSEEVDGKNIKTEYITDTVPPKDTESPSIKTRELHVILYKNNQPSDRGNIRSLNLSQIGNDENKNRLSLNLKSENVELRKDKRVKSFAQHFERLSHERNKYTQNKSEPVYANMEVQPKKLPDYSPMKKHNKRPVPVPRLKHQATKDPVINDRPKDDMSNDVLRNMSEHEENFSDKEHKLKANIAVMVTSGAKVKNQKKGTTEVPDLLESQNLLNDDLNSDSTDEELNSIEDGQIRKSDKFLVDQMPIRDSLDDNDGATASYSLIEVAGTAEKLDLRKQSNLTMEPSSLNLFNFDSTSMEENCINSDNNKKIGYFNPSFLGEASDTESFIFDGKKLDSLMSSDSKPKIVDFVPLDDATKPYYKNNHIPDYNTLEREKTYQVLNAVSTGKMDTAKGATKSSSKTGSASFSAAKKMFQDLESKSENDDVKKITVTKKKPKTLLDTSELEKSIAKSKDETENFQVKKLVEGVALDGKAEIEEI